jgi:hypothetical protein
MRSLRAGENGERSVRRRRSKRRMNLNLQTLTAHNLNAGPTIQPPTPIPPEDRCRPDGEGMQEDAHLARLDRGAPIPLTLLAQRTGTATVDAGSIDHAQTPIGFSASLLQNQRLSSRTTQRPIRRVEESRAHRSDQLSRAKRRRLAHSPVAERKRASSLHVLGQTRWSVLDQDEADDPVPGADSTPID